jgi:hypothetical protein
LEGKQKGETLDGMFGGPLGRFGGPGRPGGPGGFGPGNLLASSFQAQFDVNKNGEVSRDEFSQGFRSWFNSWDKANRGALTEEDLRAGLNETFRAPGPGGPGGPVILPLGNGPRP